VTLLLYVCGSNKSRAEIWSTFRDIAKGYEAEMADGIHATRPVHQWGSQLLLNLHCNKYLQPTDATCCKPVEPISFKHKVLAFLCVIWFVRILLIYRMALFWIYLVYLVSLAGLHRETHPAVYKPI